MSPLLWLGLTLLCIFTQGFFSMMEMAALSFNRVRLEYYVSKGVKRAEWLQYLLTQPSRLFGTVILGVNIALQIGSQSSREFYSAAGLDPSIAPLTQIFLVVIFAELAPLFAARRSAEHVVMLGIPIVYAAHRVLSPFIWGITLMIRGISRLFGSKNPNFDVFITRDELQKVLETHDEGYPEGDEFNVVVANLFGLRQQTATNVMTPLANVDMIPSHLTIGQLRKRHPTTALPIYHGTRKNIIAIAHPRDLVRLSDRKTVREAARPPWFITADTKLIPILEQFRRNNQTHAVVLDEKGIALGILSLDAILTVIFGQASQTPVKRQPVMIQRSFPGSTKIADFNRQYRADIDGHGQETFEELMTHLLDHHPQEGESIVVGSFEITAMETTLLAVKSVEVKTLAE